MQRNNRPVSQNKVIVDSFGSGAAPAPANLNLTPCMAQMSLLRAQTATFFVVPMLTSIITTVPIPMRAPRLTEKEINRLKKSEKCFNCKNKGHTAAYCTRFRKLYLFVSAALQEMTVRSYEKLLIILLSLLLGDLFTDEALVVLCKLRNKGEIKTRSLLDTGATGIGFIDKKMACHMCHVLQILFFLLAKPKPLKNFDEKPA